MSAPSYLQLALAEGSPANSTAAVAELQHDLRALGYLKSGIDGVFGKGTTRAIRALQYDLLHNDGRGSDGDAPVAMTSLNLDADGAQIVTAVDGVFSQSLGALLYSIMQDARIAHVPESRDPVTANRDAVFAIAGAPSRVAPTPFLLAMAEQESNKRHFLVPHGDDKDSFVIVGMDRNGQSQDQITSRGYGIGQATIFHHPLSQGDVVDVVNNPVGNVQNAYRELRAKFDHFVVGNAPARDRQVEHPHLPLRLCRYQPTDDRYMNDCLGCAREVRKLEIERGTPLYAGSTGSYQPTQYYASSNYSNVPDRAEFLCDWPYAARRYNGEGANSYHYQTKILLNLLRG